MKRTDIISYVALVVSVIALAVALFACPCPKRDMRGPKNRMPHPEMMQMGNNHRPDMRDNRGDARRPDARKAQKAHKAMDGKSNAPRNARPEKAADAEK